MPSNDVRGLAVVLVKGIDIARRALAESNENLGPHLKILQGGAVSEVGIVTDDGVVTCVDGDSAVTEIGHLFLLHDKIDRIFRSIESASGLYARGVHKKGRFVKRVCQVLDADARQGVHAMVTEGLRESPHNAEAYLNTYRIFIELVKRIDLTVSK